MSADYTGAKWVPCTNFWSGNNSMQRIVIHGTASGGPQTGYQLATSAEYNDGNTASTHYINDVDGTVYQVVQETDSAWGNCCVTGVEAPAGVYPTPGTGDYHLHGLDTAHNYNHDTISIENVKHSSDNSEPLTTAQYQSLVKLVVDICKRRKITPTQDTLIGHFDLDPVNRARCPGNFDWTTFRADIDNALQPAGGITVKLSSTGEIADFEDADQFQPAKTQGACGFFAVATVDAASPVGKAPTKTVAQVITEAEDWYAQYDGSNDISNFDGMTEAQCQQLLTQIGLKHYTIIADLYQIRKWVGDGYPVIINSVEDSYFDMALGDTVPYYWPGPGFNHIITVTGLTSDGNFLVRDSANVTDLNNPNSLRPGPRKYDASKIQLLWAEAVVMHGQTVPTIIGGEPTVGVPSGWTDDGKQLHNPANKFVVSGGFRTIVLNWAGGWDAGNVPLENEVDANPMEESNTGLGEGNSQTFRTSRLEYDFKQNRMFVGWLGQEYLWYVNRVTQLNTQHDTDQKTITSLTAENQALQTQLNQVQLANIPAELQTAINAAVDALTPFKK